jgi:endonuclease/exonuclease/phosphatase (EEP) superfamily protein YafD
LNILQRVCPGYAILLCLWFLFWLTTGDTLWWMALVNHAGYALFVPMPVLALIALITRNRASLIALLLVLLIAGYVYFPSPTQVPSPSQVHTLRAMSFNVLFSNSNVNTLVAVITAAQPDLIGLQEVQPDVWNVLTRQLITQYPYAYRAPDHPYGTPALLSRYPLTNPQIVDLGADRQAILARIELNSQTIMVASAHLLAYGLEWVQWQDIPATVDVRIREQNQQAHLLLQSIEPKATVIVLCDCNTRETGMTARILHTKLKSVARSVHWWLPTVSRPQLRIQLLPNSLDYIFYQGNLTPTDRYTWSDAGGSDHRPLIAEFNLQ